MGLTYNTPVISKIKLPGSDTPLIIKDAEVRANLDTLLGTASLATLGAAAWKGVDTTITADSTNLPTGGAVKTYVDAEVAKIPKLDIVVCAAQASEIPAGAVYYDGDASPVVEITGTLAASADTMYKIYLVKNTKAGAGAYVEYITIRTGTEGAYTYGWEQIGTTVVDLSGYLTTTASVAGVAFGDSKAITTASLQSALGLKDLAYASAVTASYTPAGTISNSITTVSTAITSTGSYTPVGTIETGGGTANYTPEGSISTQYTPEGTISGSVTLDTTTDTINAISKAELAVAPTFTGTAATLEHTVSGTITASTVVKPAGTISTITLDTISIGSASNWNAGSQAQFTSGAFSAGTTPSWTGSVADEVLTFTWDAGTLPTHAADTFTANSLPTLTIAETTVAKEGSYTPEFTGADLTVTLSTDASGAVSVASHSYTPEGTVSKPDITLTSTSKTFVTGATGQATGFTFTGKTATISTVLQGTGVELKFTGSEGTVSVAGNYDKASAISSTFSGTAATITSTAGTIATWTPKASY